MIYTICVNVVYMIFAMVFVICTCRVLSLAENRINFEDNLKDIGSGGFGNNILDIIMVLGEVIRS